MSIGAAQLTSNHSMRWVLWMERGPVHTGANCALTGCPSESYTYTAQHFATSRSKQSKHENSTATLRASTTMLMVCVRRWARELKNTICLQCETVRKAHGVNRRAFMMCEDRLGWDAVKTTPFCAMSNCRLACRVAVPRKPWMSFALKRCTETNIDGIELICMCGCRPWIH